MSLKDLPLGYHTLQFIQADTGESYPDHILEMFDAEIKREIRRRKRKGESDDNLKIFLDASVQTRLQLHTFLETEAHGPH